MDYKKIYDQIIEKARRLDRNFNDKSTYTERHHVVPKCLGGEGKVSEWKTHTNIVVLTSKEHFICHKLLCRLYPNHKKLIYALWAMCNQKGRGQEKRYTPSSRSYEESKTLFSKMQVGVKRSDHSKFLKEWWTSERRDNYSRNNPMKNPEHSIKISGDSHGSKKEKHRGKWKWSQERRTNWVGNTNPMFGKKGKDHHNSKQVLELETGKVFESLTEASSYIGISKSFMHSKIKNKQGYDYLYR